MEYVTSLYLPGAVTLWCAMFFAVAAVWGYSLVLRGDLQAVAFARRAYRLFALSVVLGSVVLGILLMIRDFRIEYVYQYSGLELPFHYQIAAFWAGQKGSFLIWLFCGAVLGLPLIRSAGKQEAPVMLVYTLTVTGLLFILVRESPFVMLPETPLDGAGLNPLLQDDWMVIHPPIMFVGYALSAVPFAFAVAALWKRDFEGWARRAFPWALAGFLVLGAAITLGGYWAYETLGWGGYWGWDPVENASLIPWLLGITLIHGLHMERVKGRYRRANLVLACLIFMSVLYGTFLTRSGVLADFSVHSFVDLGITVWLVGLMAFFGLLAAGLLVLRLREVPTGRNEDPLLARGTFLVLATITVLVSALLVTLGTSAPLITGTLSFLFDAPAQVGPEWYNRVHFPIALLTCFLLAAVPFLTWRGESTAALGRKLLIPGIIAALATAGAAAAGLAEVWHGVLVFLAVLAMATNLEKTFARARAGGLKAAGGYLAHVGVGVAFLGFLASSAYDQSTKVTLTQGEPAQVADMQLTYTRFIPRQGRVKERMEVEVVRDGGEPFFVYPKLFVNDRTRQVMANPDIRNFPLLDFYVSPIDFDPGRPAGAPASFQLAKGEAFEIGDLEIRFDGFRMEGNAQEAMLAGQSVTVQAALQVTSAADVQNGGGEAPNLIAEYTLNPRTGEVLASPVPVPGGGFVRVGGINAGDGAVRLETVGVGPQAAGTPAKLSVDVTRKPLIQLVWYGIYILLAGGLLSAWQRFYEARVWEKAQGESKAA